MKILIEVEDPGLDNFIIQNPDVPAELASFVGKLIRFRTRIQQPHVQCEFLQDNAVVVEADALIRLQRKAGAA